MGLTSPSNWLISLRTRTSAAIFSEIFQNNNAKAEPGPHTTQSTAVANDCGVILLAAVHERRLRGARRAAAAFPANPRRYIGPCRSPGGRWSFADFHASHKKHPGRKTAGSSHH